MAANTAANTAAAAVHLDTSTSSNAEQPHTIDTFRGLLKQLVLSQPPLPTTSSSSSSSSSSSPSPPPTLTSTQLQSLFDHLSNPAFTADVAHHAQIGSCLTALRLLRVDSQAETLSIASSTFLKKCNEVSVSSQDEDEDEDEISWEVRRRRQQLVVEERLKREPGWRQLGLKEPPLYMGTLDLVGTGGDGQDTFNVSTTAALVASGVPGVRVCKHGAKASSSTSGSADLLLNLGIPLFSLTPKLISSLLPTSSFVFLFAQLFHPSLAPLAPIRRALGHPTIFNILGPLINPARPRRCILGVHSPHLGHIFALALLKAGCESAWIVCGKEGLDEISIEGETDVWELSKGEIRHFTISPWESFGIPSHPLKDVASYSAGENAALLLRMFQPGGEASIPHSSMTTMTTSTTSTAAHHSSTLSTQDPPLPPPLPLPPTDHLPPIPPQANLRALLDYTLLQASALLYVAGYASDLPHAVQLAKYSLNSGSALRSLEEFRRAACSVEYSSEGGREGGLDGRD